MQRRHLSILTATLLLVAGVLAMPSPAGGVAGFGDVDSDQFYTEPVQWMVDDGITTGTSPTCFSPADAVTRGQAAAFMWRMEGSPTGSPAHPFTDVEADWQQDPISWMAATGITTGTSATTYTPEGLVTRGEVAALLHRLAGSPDAPPPSQFTDVITPWQITPIGWMVQEGITTGTTASTFSPDKTVTRAEIATFFYRYKGSPSVVVDPTHPAMPPCEDQVPGPFTTGTLRITLDTQLVQNHQGDIEVVVDNVTLDCAGHTVTGSGSGTGISLSSRTGVTIRNCHVTGFRFGIGLGDSNDNTVEANKVHDNVEPGQWSAGINVTGASTDNAIRNNVVADNCDPTVDGQAGINLGPDANANTVIGNSVTGNLWRGINLAGDSNLVAGNEVRANGDHGLAIGGNFNRIEGNQAIGNGTSELAGDGSGIRLGGGASGNVVVNNNFDGNQIGISPWTDVGGGNTFTGNTANDNAWWGIEDQSTAGTDNIYTNNTCTGNGSGGSSPSGLCSG